jgi:hypothetical protein
VPQTAAGFGRKALLVLLYPTGSLLGRPSCGGGSKVVSGSAFGPISGEAGIGKGRDRANIAWSATPLGDGEFSRFETVIATPSKACSGRLTQR